MDSAWKDVECTFGILKKLFLFIKKTIETHAPEKIKDCFVTCVALHNWLREHDGWDDLEGRAGLMTEEDAHVEHDPCDDSNWTRKRVSSHHGFEGNFTRSETRRLNSAAHRDDGDSDKLASEQTMCEERRLSLIDHCSLMHRNRTLQCDTRQTKFKEALHCVHETLNFNIVIFKLKTYC